MRNDSEGIVPENDEQEDDNSSEDNQIDWKAEAEKARAEATKFRRMAEQRAKKLEKSSAEDAPTKSEQGLDYGKKAFLAANGFKGADEYSIFEEVSNISGKSLDELVEDGYVLHRIKTLREEKATAAAVPSKQNRNGQSARNEVDYWLAKGELPKDNPELARKVVNAKLAAYKQKTKFAE